jgi:gamma-glutamyltranspeptidase/glutathione hydrolase
MSQQRPASPAPARAFSSVAHGAGGAAATPEARATGAALRILHEGGSAVDAAIAAAAVLGVTRPFWCGVGGGGFMLVYAAAARRVAVYEHREAAPEAIESALGGGPVPPPELCAGPLYAGVPGVPSGWETAHRAHGRRPLAAILEPAIEVAGAGFEADAAFITAIRDNLARLAAFSSTRELYLTAAAEPPAPGTLLKNPDLANTYRTLAQHGAEPFYRGSVGDAILRSVAAPPAAGPADAVAAGPMTESDLAAYRTIERAPVTSGYRGRVLYGAPPPSSGGIAIASMLQILEAFPLGSMPRAQALHHFIEASRLVFADRAAYLGDPAAVRVSAADLLSPSYVAARRRLIGATAAPEPVAPGLGRAEGTSTAHLTVCDRDGNVAAYTFTLGSIGGSGMVVPGAGFLLNSELTDFTFAAGHANAPAGRKRPRSSMSPTLVCSDGRPVLALGSPGGATIIPAVAHTLLYVVDFEMPLADAIAAPRVLPGDRVPIPADAAFLASPEAEELRRLGHHLAEASFAGEVAAIAFDGRGRVTAASEPAPRGTGAAGVEAPDRDP